MTRLDITHGKFRLLATPGDDGLDTVRVLHAESGQDATPEEAKLRGVAFLHRQGHWKRVTRTTTFTIEAHLMAYNGTPRTLHDRLRMDQVLMP